MATKKDLVEAHAFSRRRLVTAFLSGAPGGREVEPSRPGRMIIGGLALSVLLVAGAAIASVLAARTPADWQKPGIIVSQGGPPATYVILDPDDPVLHPILNSTSAQLIFGADQQPTTVSRDTLDKQTPSDTIGIYDAPPELPETSKMIYSGWTVCTGDGLGLRLDVDEQPAVRSGTGYGFTVTTGKGAYYLVTVGADDGGPPRARAFPVPDLASSDAMLDELGVASRSGALSVPADFVRLFETGGTLDFSSFGFDPTSGRLPQGLRDVPGATVGAYVEDASGDGRVLTPDGILRLDPFALAVYRRSVLPGTSQFPPQLQLPEGTDLPVTFTDTTYADASWPTSVISRETPVRQVCAVLNAAEGERPGVRLGIEPGDEASAAAVDPDDISVRVQPGHGAFVYDGAFDQSTGGEPWVLNSQGIMYSISDAQSVAQLQYDTLPAPVVPDPWVRLFESGVDLSTAAALCPPVPTGTVAPDQVCRGPGEAASPSAGAVAGSSG